MTNELEPVVTSELVRGLARQYGLSPEAFVNTVRSVAMPQGHRLSDLISCLVVASELRLNPLTREVFFSKTKGGGIQAIISIDGWVTLCNRNENFDGMTFVTHKNEDGSLDSMTCRIFRKDRSHPIEVTEDFKECAAAGGPVWRSSPHRMLRNRALSQCARIAFGAAGVMLDQEFTDWQAREGAPIDITPPQGVAMVTMYEGKEPETQLDPRDGGPLPSGWKGRPSSSAFKEVGGTDQFNELRNALEQCSSRAGLELLYDNGFHAGLPWGRFPSAWARMLHNDYCAKLDDLPVATDADYQVDDVPTADDGQVADAILQAQSRPELVTIWEGLTEDERETYGPAYDTKYDSLGETML